MFHQDDNDEAFAPCDAPFPGWTAPQYVVTQHVEAALTAAVRLAGKVLEQPSEAAIMQIFQTMMDRTAFGKHTYDDTSSSIH
ncbi:hypothetical protein [Corticimicrobacter populi]|uniref:Uncharacterized protein n=1 Tax=Corticimicrobacter populi TaxID=2175229 RepID=A0A2V1JXL5_9BURK|nr:hypothetical protein [Corticimicrobacter populi]PWF23212.1 hypothetical protein DD235_09490 [Corticimicrobacter populi]